MTRIEFLIDVIVALVLFGLLAAWAAARAAARAAAWDAARAKQNQRLKNMLADEIRKNEGSGE